MAHAPGTTRFQYFLRDFRNVLEHNDAPLSQILIAGDFNDDEVVAGPCQSLQQNSRYEYRTIKVDALGRKIVTTRKSARKLDWIFAGHKFEQDKLNLALLTFPNLNATASDHNLHAIQLSTGPVNASMATTTETLHSAKNDSFWTKVAKFFIALLEILSLLFSSSPHRPPQHRPYHGNNSKRPRTYRSKT
jgi:hypothetical protein